MRIPYNVAYQVNFVLRGGKRPTSRVLHAADEIDIPEVSGVDAPIVATWRSDNGAVPHEVRYFDGRFYAPFFQGSTKLAKPTSARAAFESKLMTGEKATAMPTSDKIAYSLGDNRDLVLRHTKKIAEEMLVVDGAPFRVCHQPRLMLELDYEWTVFYILSASYKYDGLGHVKGIGTHIIAPLTHKDRLDAIVAEKPDAGRVWHRYSDVEIYIPELLEFDTKAEACGRTVGQAVTDNESQLYHWPRPVAEEFLSVRAEYKRWLDNPDDVDVVDLLDRVFTIFTTNNIYNQQLLCSFLENYETVQKNLPEYDVTIHVKAPRAEP